MNKTEREKISESICNLDWPKAEKLILKELSNDLNDPWLLTRLSRCLLNKGDHEKAVSFAKKALKYAPENPEIQWDLAEAMYMSKYFKESLLYFKKILNCDLRSFAEKMTYEKYWDKKFQNACRFKISTCYLQLNQLSRSINWLKKYLMHIQKGVGFPYSITYVKKMLNNMQKLKEKIDSKKPLLWISLLEVIPIKSDEFSCAFTNGLAFAESKKGAEKLYRGGLAKRGYKLIKAEGTEVFDVRILKSKVNEEIHELAKSVKKYNNPQFGTFCIVNGK